MTSKSLPIGSSELGIQMPRAALQRPQFQTKDELVGRKWAIFLSLYALFLYFHLNRPMIHFFILQRGTSFGFWKDKFHNTGGGVFGKKIVSF